MIVTENIKQYVWEHATAVPGYDAHVFRKDPCGAWIVWDRYGMDDNLYGWEIDHIIPVSYLEGKGVSDELINHPINLRALQCDNNRKKSNDFPSYFSAVISEGNKNIRKELIKVISDEKLDELNSFFGI